MIVPTTFISASEKRGVSLWKQAANFISISPGEEKSDIPVLIFLPVRNEGIFSYLD